MKNFVCLFYALAVFNVVFAQDDAKKMATFLITKTRISNTEALLQIVATPVDGTKLFSINANANKADSLTTSIALNNANKPNLIGDIIENGTFMDTIEKESKSKIRYTNGNITWTQKIKLTNVDSFKLTGAISYGYFNNGINYAEQEINEQFNGRKMPFVEAEKNNANATAANGETINADNKKPQSLWWLLITGIGAGLLALLTPCVYSMLPITVSFFTKKSKTKAQGIRNASIYSASIILIFIVIGGGLSAIFGPAILNTISTHWLANLLFFVVFIIFGVSFLGAFEIQLPNKWANSTDGKANSKSVSGIFFMALTLVIVSFSCTGPFIGTLIKLIAEPGASRIAPVVGFFGFGFGLAIPFFIFSLMPTALNSLSKSGGWQNALKVTLGILEIAFAMKFLSNVDQQFGWGLLNRDIYIAIWVILFAILGLYLLGKLHFSHDSDLPKNDFGLPHLSVTRLSFAIAALVFALYLIPGMFGASLQGISGFLPPYGTQQFKLGAATTAATAPTINANAPIKYTQLFANQHPEAVSKYGIPIYNDYTEALAASKATGKPLFIDFTGINCVNCRKYEATLWNNETVAQYMKEKFIVASLFTDATSSNFELPEEEFFESPLLKEKVTTIGQLFKHKQLELDGKLVSPAYIFVNPDGKKITDGFFYSESATSASFVKYMDMVLAKK